jgi:dTDP-4-dehydrorhamnose reductase
MTILLVGGAGQLGWELRRCLSVLDDLAVPSHSEFDLASADAVREGVRSVRPRLIINAGAYTAVDRAESEPQVAMAVNGTAPGVLAEEARRLDVPLVHYSTDYVFDGAKDGPYCEGDQPNPLNVYGRTKLAGEQAVQASGAPHLILRTSWVYGARGQNFLRAMLRLAGEREVLNVVDDQIGAPTWSRMIAEATAQLLGRMRARDGSFHLRKAAGLYHLTAAGATSWYGFARAIVFNGPLRDERKAQEVRPIRTADYPTAARRPANSCLDCTALRRSFGIGLPNWEISLQQVMEELSPDDA